MKHKTQLKLYDPPKRKKHRRCKQHKPAGIIARLQAQVRAAQMDAELSRMLSLHYT